MIDNSMGDIWVRLISDMSSETVAEVIDHFGCTPAVDVVSLCIYLYIYILYYVYIYICIIVYIYIYTCMVDGLEH